MSKRARTLISADAAVAGSDRMRLRDAAPSNGCRMQQSAAVDLLQAFGVSVDRA